MERPDVKRWNDVARQFLGEEFFEGFTKSSEEKSGPPADVYYSSQEVIVLVELPGVENIHDLKMHFQEGQLKLNGSLTNPYPQLERKVSERQIGSFEKIIPLDKNVSSKYTSAKYQKGILELRFPIIKSGTSQKIRFKTKR